MFWGVGWAQITRYNTVLRTGMKAVDAAHAEAPTKAEFVAQRQKECAAKHVSSAANVAADQAFDKAAVGVNPSQCGC